MDKQNRRDFFKNLAIVGAGVTGLSATTAKASPKIVISDDRMGVLVDTTVCVGCRNCEWACKGAHGIEAGSIESYEDRSVFNEKRRPSDKSFTVINEYSPTKGNNIPIDVKVQCMHCDHPACASACIVGAFTKEENGAVVWDGGKCIGCRYCMVACPFQIPTFDYLKAIEPEIRKCDFCFERTKVGKLPACIDICPMEALTYGKRNDLIRIAKERIKRHPDRYENHLFGEKEVGGTAWMYLSAKKAEELEFPKLGNNPAPGVSEAIQHGIFSYFVPPVAYFALLGGIMWITKRHENDEEDED